MLAVVCVAKQGTVVAAYALREVVLSSLAGFAAAAAATADLCVRCCAVAVCFAAGSTPFNCQDTGLVGVW
jgi:hypothetical protein